MEERRRFERVAIPPTARISVLDETGRLLGPLRVLGRGGMMFSCAETIDPGTPLSLTIADERDGVVRRVKATVRYCRGDGVAVEFEELDADAAVDIGVWIGKAMSA